jgi:hypothetical protein
MGPGWSYTAEGSLSDVLFAKDGSVFTVESDANSSARVVRLTPDGAAGWSWSQPGMSAAWAALTPDGSLDVVAGVPSGTSSGWTESLHRLTTAGKEAPGFPVALPSGNVCSMALAGDGTAFVACRDTSAGTLRTTVASVGRDGRVLAGWPAPLDGGGDIVGVLRDGSLVLKVASGDATKTVTSFVALGRDGKPVSGWHIGSFGDLATATIDALGSVVVVDHDNIEGQCGAFRTTTYAILGGDGKAAAGWPVTIGGWGSDPVVRSDGSLVVSASGGRMLAWSASGAALPGWPASGVDVSVGCFWGSNPVAADGGAVMLAGTRRATMFNVRGAAAAGWPVTVPGSVARSCTGCTEGLEGPVDPSVGRSVVYLAAYLGSTPGGLGGQPQIVALDLQGKPRTSLSRRIGAPGDVIQWIRTAPDGRVWVELSTAASDRLVLIAS